MNKISVEAGTIVMWCTRFSNDFLLFGLLDLKQELQVRQKAIHETPDNEKHEKAVVDENEKSDPTKSPLAYPSSNNNNKLPSSVPLKRKHETSYCSSLSIIDHDSIYFNGIFFLLLLFVSFLFVFVYFNTVPVTTDTGITQAARHSALNIVGDLLRRVGVRRITFGLTSFLFYYDCDFFCFEKQTKDAENVFRLYFGNVFYFSSISSMLLCVYSV